MAAAMTAATHDDDRMSPLRPFCVVYHDKTTKEWPYWCEVRQAMTEDDVWCWLFVREFQGMWQREFNEDRKLWWPDDKVVQCSAADPHPHSTCFVALQCNFHRDPANVDAKRIESYFAEEQRRDPTLARIKACLQSSPRAQMFVVPVGGRPAVLLDNK